MNCSVRLFLEETGLFEDVDVDLVSWLEGARVLFIHAWALLPGLTLRQALS